MTSKDRISRVGMKVRVGKRNNVSKSIQGSGVLRIWPGNTSGMLGYWARKGETKILLRNRKVVVFIQLANIY